MNLTGSVGTVNAEALESRPVQNAVQALQGMVPGLQISTTSGTLDKKMDMSIRGTGTIGEGSEGGPLVLIDGMEGDINSINPQDIENISVLKDAAASSIYGSRAPFGVILVTTKSKYSINSLVYWVTYVHNVVYSFYRSMIYCYINSTQRCAGSIEIDIIPTNGADKRKFSPFAPYFPVTNVIKRYFYPYFPAIIGIKGYSFPYFPYLSGIMKIKTALYSLFSRLDWHKTVVFPCLGEIYEGIRSLSWEIPVT